MLAVPSLKRGGLARPLSANPLPEIGSRMVSRDAVMLAISVGMQAP
jgi:hypothetical protein